MVVTGLALGLLSVGHVLEEDLEDAVDWYLGRTVNED